MQRWQKHPHILPLLLWTLLWFCFFGTLLLGVEYLAQSDLLTQFHAFGRFQAAEMLAGRLPLWSPGSYAGFPFAADTQAAVFYLPRWLTIFLSAPWSFSYHVLLVEGVVHIWFLGLFTYLLAFDITKNRWASLLAAVGFGLSGFITSYPILQLAIVEAITWLPLVLLLLRRGVHGKRPLPWLISAGLVLGLSFLAGHPQTFLHMAYLAAIYYLFLTVRARWAWRWFFGLGILVGGMAVGISAVTWLPALQYVQASTRSDVTYEFVAHGFSLLDYLQLVMPRTITSWSPMYVGVPTIMLVMLAWLLHRDSDELALKSEILFWSFVGGATLLLSLGDRGLLFEPLYHIAPGFSLFRQQERIVSLLTLSLVLLAAIGFTLWQHAEDESRKRVMKQLFWLSLGTILFCGFILLAIKKIDWLLIWGQVGIITAVTLTLLWHKNRLSWRGMGLVLLLCLDLFLLSRQQLNYQAGSPDIYWPQPSWLTTLQNEDPVGRIDTLGYFTVNVGELHGVQDIRGISPLKPAALSRWDELSFTRRWQLLNVTHVVAEDGFESAMGPVISMTESIFPGQSFAGNLYQYEDAFPRAWLVYEPTVVADAESAFQILKNPDFDLAKQVVLTMPDTDFTAVSPPSIPPKITINQQSSTQLQIQATTETPGILVISEWDYSGWQAKVDGEPSTIETADYALQALLIPAGTHEITLTFTPSPIRIGIVLALITLLIGAIIAWRWQPIITSRDPILVFQNAKIHLAIPLKDEKESIIGSQKIWLGILLFVLLLGFGLRLFQLGHQELRGDEAFSYLFAQRPAQEITGALIREGDPHSPLHYLLLHSWMNLSGDSEFAMRYISVLPSLLLIPLLYQLGRLLGGRKLALFSAFWVALSPSLIWLAQDVRNQYNLTLFWGTLATVILVGKLYGEEASRFRRQRIVYWGAYVLAATLTIYSHYYGLFILIAHAGYLWCPRNGRWQRLGRWILAGFCAAFLFLPWVVAIWRTLFAADQLNDPSQPELADYLVKVGLELTMGSDVAGGWVRWVFATTLLIVVLGALWLLKHKPNWGVLFTSWLLGGTLVIYLIRFSRATFNNFYIAVVSPAWWLLFAVGFFVLWHQRWRGWRAFALIISLCILLANMVGLKNYYFDLAYSRSNGYREAVAVIEARMETGDIFMPNFPDPTWGYYLRHLDMPNVMQPVAPNLPAAESEQALQEITTMYDRVWFVPYESSSHWDSEKVVERWLDYHLLHESQSTHQNVDLWAFRPLRTSDDVTLSIDETLKEKIVLQAAYLTRNGQPQNPDEPLAVVAGDELKVSLIWSAHEAVEENYTVFVHLIAEDGSLQAQHDGAPLFGTRPTTTWQPNEQLLDRHELQVAETGFMGNGRLMVGMYDSNTLERLPFANGETALELTTVIIQSR